MSNTFNQPGDAIPLTAPSGGVVSGVAKVIGGFFVIPSTTVDEGAQFTANVTGVHTLPKTSAQAWTEGQKIYWDEGNARADSTPTIGMLIGAAVAAAANPSATGRIRLNGGVPEIAEGPQAAVASLVDGTSGTPDDTAIANLADGSTYATDHAAIEDNFATLAAKVNQLIARLEAAGVITPSA
jgi:predicted RecA/RadA family phage recombinase